MEESMEASIPSEMQPTLLNGCTNISHLSSTAVTFDVSHTADDVSRSEEEIERELFFDDVKRWMDLCFYVCVSMAFVGDMVISVLTIIVFYYYNYRSYFIGALVSSLISALICASTLVYDLDRSDSATGGNGKRRKLAALRRFLLNFPCQLTVVSYRIRYCAKSFRDLLRSISQPDDHSQSECVGSNSVRNHQAMAADDCTVMNKHEWTFSKVMVMHCVLHSFPLLVINGLNILVYDNAFIVQYISAFVSFTALSLGVAAYEKARKEHDGRRRGRGCGQEGWCHCQGLHNGQASSRHHEEDERCQGCQGRHGNQTEELEGQQQQQQQHQPQHRPTITTRSSFGMAQLVCVLVYKMLLVMVRLVCIVNFVYFYGKWLAVAFLPHVVTVFAYNCAAYSNVWASRKGYRLVTYSLFSTVAYFPVDDARRTNSETALYYALFTLENSLMMALPYVCRPAVGQQVNAYHRPGTPFYTIVVAIMLLGTIGGVIFMTLYYFVLHRSARAVRRSHCAWLLAAARRLRRALSWAKRPRPPTTWRRPSEGTASALSLFTNEETASTAAAAAALPPTLEH